MMSPSQQRAMAIAILVGLTGGIAVLSAEKPVDTPAKSATMPVLERDTQMSEQSVYDKLMHKVDREFALLSTEAKDNIKRMIHVAMTDGFDRGVQAARPAPKPANPTELGTQVPRPTPKPMRPSSD